MANRVLSFLESIGHDFEVGLQKLDPFVKEAVVLGTAAEAEVSSLDPGLGVVFKTVVSTVALIEQKFTAMGQQTGSDVQKLATAMTILQPVVSQAFAAAGKASDATTVSNYVSAVVDFLNAIPASGTATPAPATAPAPEPVTAS